MPGEGLVVIGVVSRAHGVRGAVRVRATGETLARLVPGERVLAVTDGLPPVDLTIRTIGGEADFPVISFAGYEDRDGAQALAGRRICVAEARLAPPGDEDTFYRFELVGMQVRYGDRILGTVAAVHETPANDVLEVATPDGGEPVLVPFTKDAVPSVDRDSATIVVREDLFSPGEAQ